MRKLSDLVSVGKATVEDFHVMGITRVEDLVDRKAEDLFFELCEKTNAQHDICCLDVFRAAIEQAKNPDLEKEKCNWWYWSKQRKLSEAINHD